MLKLNYYENKKNQFHRLFAVMWLITAIAMTSCNNENLDGFTLSQEDDSQSIEILGMKVVVEDKTLSFKNENELQDLIYKIKNQQAPSTRLTGDAIDSLTTDKSPCIDGFQSLYDIFVEAMKEAESYYNREGVYEEFKEKYATLYFPEYGDDYSAYLPISDPTLSKFLNREGKVIIGGVTVDMKDVSTYEQLKELGLTPPEEVVILSDNGIPLNTRAGNVFFPGAPFQLLPDKTFQMNNRRIWVTLDDVTGDQIARTKTGFDICFRKKEFLGAWYNHWALTKTYAHIGSQGLRAIDDKMKDGYSSHNHSFFLPKGVEISTPTNTPGYFKKDVYGEAQIYYDALKDYTFIVPLHYTFFRWW